MRIPGVPYVQGRNDYSDSDGRKYGVAIHNTSNDATAEQEASYATRRTDGISAHLYVDRDSVVQSLDTEDRAGHAGSSEGNNHAVAVEITGVNGWTRQQWLDRVAWDKLGAALAHVVRKYGVAVRRASVAEMRNNPKVRAFYGHDDMRRAWGGTTHTDPGSNFPWDKLFSSVNAALGNSTKTGEDDMSRRDALLGVRDWMVAAQTGTPPSNDYGMGESTAREAKRTVDALLKPLADRIDALAARPQVQPAPVDAAVLAAELAGNTAFINALAKAVNDDHAARMRD
ncbi:peptidoglycan recognition family protein [Micromonospora sp. WMMD1102]|uniref:peptidoglycan recognition protein family protein n=1 Tax=Micromonospora sp. WMMD1102 TaxID=3016105 RepID=UPI0024155E20|nr:peptidoglycan recognition family protein [Micromonospora sp. WMMD1102]MDG4790364.1 peptidoglycan recognition family protein [Micromonospora sp. WMMD1102]